MALFARPIVLVTGKTRIQAGVFSKVSAVRRVIPTRLLNDRVRDKLKEKNHEYAFE